MKAAIVTELGAGFHIDDVQLAEALEREVIVDVKASGLCHTDLTASRTDVGYLPPVVFGHEVSGVVSAVGSGVSRLSVGDHVVGCLIQSCGACSACLTGRTYQCEHPEATLRGEEDPPRMTIGGETLRQAFGLGGFAQRALIHENQLVKINPQVPFPQAALLGCGVVTGAGAVLNTADVQAGDSVVIIGAGGVGLNAVNGAVLAGATTIIAIDVDAAKLDKARRFGATHVIDSTHQDPLAEVMRLTGRGADAAFDFVGIPAVTHEALQMVRVGGGLYCIGILDPRARIPLITMGLISAQKRIQGVFMGSTTPQRDIPMYADLYLQGRFELDSLVSREISLSEINEGYEALREPGVTRVVVTSGLS